MKKKFLEEEIAFSKEKENIAFVETNLKDIEGRIIALSKRANRLNMEYLNRLVSNAVKVVRDRETSSVRSKSVKQIVLLTTVVALFMAVFLAFFIEYIKNASKASSANKRT